MEDFGNYKEFWATDCEECPDCRQYMTMAWLSTNNNNRYICSDCIDKEIV